MPREDCLSSRFDYLFEPLDAEAPADDTVDSEPTAADPPSGAGPVWVAFAAFVLATLGAAAIVAVLLLQRPDAANDPFDVRLDPAPLSTAVPVIPSQPAPVPAAPTEPPQPVESTPGQAPGQPPGPPTQPPPTVQREPGSGVRSSPTTRPPISVAPKPHAPFPNQGPRGGGEPRTGGGLLGGLPGPGLPGPP